MKKKRLIAFFSAIVMLIVGVVVHPNTLKAENNQVKDVEIIYDNSYVMNDYWKETKKTAPVMNGYVFGGWYTSADGENFTALYEEDVTLDVDGNVTNTNTYAKFVPAYVLSMMTQLQSDTTSETEKTYLRVITTTDSKKYQNVGFDIWYNNTIQEDERGSVVRKVYSSLKKKVDNEEKTVTPAEEFGASSKYFAVVKIQDIYKANFEKIIYVRPYWTTQDGTKVEGLAKYMHIEDGYNDYYSVPVNLQTGKEIAAGIVTLKYDATRLEIISNNGVEAGRILSKMSYTDDAEQGIITFAANSNSVTAKDKADGIYANVRFKLKSGITAADSYEFDMSIDKDKFADWDEEYVNDIYAVDYKY